MLAPRSAVCLALAFSLVALPAMALAQDDVARGNTAFALDLYQRLREGEGNRFLSPLSVSTALAMTYAGARDQTAAQMAKVLHFTTEHDKLHPAMGALVRQLNGRKLEARWPQDPDAGKPALKLVLANALWGQSGYPFRKEFTDTVSAAYEAGLRETDFRADAEAARKTINGWVEEKTRGKIKDLLQPGVVGEATRLVLTNAIYFKAAWATPFHESNTRDGEFRLAGGKTVKARFMRRTGRFAYGEGKEFQWVELPYAGNHAALLLLVPREPAGLAALERQVTAENLAAWTGSTRRAQVQLGLPRFRMTSRFELATTLQSMGMTDAFRFPGADFSGMTGNRELFIGAVIHKAFVDVNEAGTEAAAATAVVMKGGGMEPDRPVVLEVDRPFLFLIRDRATGSVLFIGRVADPTAG